MSQHTHIVIDTKFGKIDLVLTSGTHIYATTNPGSGRDELRLPWVIRGKAHDNVNAHLYRWSADGAFHIGEEKHAANEWQLMQTGLFMTASSFARAATYVEIMRVVNAWASTPSAKIVRLFDKAEDQSLSDEIERKVAKRDELQAQASALTDEIDALWAKRAAITGGGGKR